MHRYRLIIFDFDGTLADSIETFTVLFKEAITRFGLNPVSDERLNELRKVSAREVIQELGVPFWKMPLIVRWMRTRMTAEVQHVQLFSGVREALAELSSAGPQLAIVSSNSEENIRKILGPEMSGLFSVFECGASLFGKASRFRRVLKRTGIPVEETITIGDEIRDAEAAKEAGIAFGAVSWGYTEVCAFDEWSPSLVLRSPSDLCLRTS